MWFSRRILQIKPRLFSEAICNADRRFAVTSLIFAPANNWTEKKKQREMSFHFSLKIPNFVTWFHCLFEHTDEEVWLDWHLELDCWHWHERLEEIEDFRYHYFERRCEGNFGLCYRAREEKFCFERRFVQKWRITWSAAFGSRLRIKFAASLFFETIEQANGVWFCLFRIERSNFGARINKLIIFKCWLIMATWTGVLPSLSW